MTTKRYTPWTADRINSQQGRRVVITGANSGIGWETALELARKGAEIILPARSQSKADDAITRIRRQVPGAKLISEVLDLADLSSVRAFAARYIERFPSQSLDLLINNAGVMAVPTRELTVDGFERQFGTNYLGPFTLTALLLPSIKPQPGSRIVTVSSSAGKWGKLDFDNLQSERVYKPMRQAYGQSKLADSIFALELQRRLTAIGSPILSTAAHPGYALTNLQKGGSGEIGFVLQLLSAALKPVASQDAAHGALPTLFAAVAPEATPGGYYGPDRVFELKGHPVPVPIPKTAQDVSVAKRLWAESERLTGVSFGPLSAVA
ncbi:oxidoreductase [Granulicella sp. S156]|uniref:oxidoreductase n=1 Tax=Granulicella sp. S156 TaxID=1747224 RepID=UPI00131D4212|nr:oxidoreductase [Granulicella sp. S156]